MNVRLLTTIIFHILISLCYFLLGCIVIFWNIWTPENWHIAKLDEMPLAYRLVFGIGIFAYGLFRIWRAYRNYQLDKEAESEDEA
jgi:TRAP-type C4-dicarboxylate transport system permease small subunit